MTYLRDALYVFGALVVIWLIIIGIVTAVSSVADWIKYRLRREILDVVLREIHKHQSGEEEANEKG